MFYLIFILTITVFLIAFSIRKKITKTKFEAIHLQREKIKAPKILYLRAFNIDGDDDSNGNVSILKLLPKEVDLANALIKFNYHLVAVGKPDEELPEIGFHRKKFSHSEWQEEVLKLMHKSILIIWRPDITPGVLWEIGKLLEFDYRDKLIIWTEMGCENLQNVQQARYNVFKRKVFELFTEVLPPYDKYKKFLVSENKDEWLALNDLRQVPIYKKISG